MTEGSGGKKLPQPPGTLGRTSPPPTPAQRLRQTGSFPQQMPAAEAPTALSPREQLLEKAGQFLSPSRPVTLLTDSAGRVLLDERVIGEYRQHEKRILIYYDPVRNLVERHLCISPFLARDMKIFFEISESSIEAYASSEIGSRGLRLQMR